MTLWPGCSVKKNNFFSRSYHGTTTHYNFYFNARDRMNQGATALANAHEDKYDRVLSIFKYGTLEQAKAGFGDMDEAIKKASISISRHSIYAKSKKDSKVAERNPWIDDCYLLIGKCQFYKHDYWTAIETFQYTSSEYKDSPIRPEALLWLTKSYLELGKTVDAEYLIDYLKADKKFPENLRGHYNAVVAQYHLIKNDVPRAIESLKTASATAKKKDDRARYTFILGQLLQKENKLDSAYLAYQKVIKLNPPYEMAFNARINRARCYDINSGNSDVVKRELNKMLRDEKNEEFKDQIYYALAGISRREKNEPLAIDYLNQSLRAGGSNTTQKALSYIELADIYLKRPEYIPAAAYYDSTLSNLSNDHPDFFDIQAKRNSLDRLVKNLKVIMLEDSVQRLAALSPEQRAAVVDSLIAFEDAEKERKAMELEEQQKLEEQQVLEEKELKSQPRNLSQPSTSQGAWYFYNQSAMSFGFNEFLKKWGNRKLEDNWRRSEKTLAFEELIEEPEMDSIATISEAENDSIAKLDAAARKTAYLNKIPVTEQQINESNLRIAEAYYNTGVIYREQLNNLPESINSFETLDRRFPENKFKLPSYYNLYRTSLTLGDSARAERYKSWLLSNYPESEYSKLILNPNFFKDIQRKTAVLEVFYENTYRSYINGQYEDVIERKTMADSLFPPNKLTPKFALLKALAVGKTRPVEEFRFSLEDIIRVYPKDTVATRAQQILDFLQGRTVPRDHPDSLLARQQLNEAIESAVAWTFVPESPQMFLILFQKNALNPAETTGKLTSYNNLNFQDYNLKVQNGNIDLTLQYITIMSFPNKNEAMDYYMQVMEEQGLLTDFDPALVQFFVISQDNLTQLARSKNITAYGQFFQKNYLQ